MSNEAVWKPLLRKALACIDTFDRHKIKANWSFGGGTAMMMTYGHRDSRDIGIFVRDPQYLGWLTPRLQDQIQVITACTAYNESSNVLKLVLDTGEIDFIVAAPLTKKPYEGWTFEGRKILRERPVEIVAKKVFYRAEEFAVRDVFDLACLLEREYGEVLKEEALFRAKQELLLTRLLVMQKTYKKMSKEKINIRAGFERLRDEAIEKVLDFYQETPA
jgi:hypothetical protein